MNISELVIKKDVLIDTLKEIMTRYLLNTMTEMNDDTKREFQKKLYEIPNWSDRKREKEFARFLKYIYKKKYISESDLNKMISDIIFLNIKILTSYPIEINAPDSQALWYKLITLTGKHFYNKIKYKIDTDDTDVIGKIIDVFFQKYIPLNDIISTEVEKVRYNFGDVEGDVEGDNFDGNNFDGNNFNSDVSLKYVSPDHFYYNPVTEPLPIDSSKAIYIKQKINLL